MNNSIGVAQEQTGKVTARMMLECIKAGNDSLYLHGNAVLDRPSYSDSFIFTMTSTRKAPRERTADGSPDYSKRQSETATRLDVPGFVSNGSTSERKYYKASPGFGERCEYSREAGAYRPLKGFWSLSLGKDEQIRAVLDLLPRDAEVAFRVALDYGTHEYLVRADCKMQYETHEGLHADHLYLVATWTARGKRVEKEFLLDVQVIPHNTARFGSPGSKFG